MDSQGTRRSSRKRTRKRSFEPPDSVPVESAEGQKDPSPNIRRSSRRRRSSLSESEDANKDSSEDSLQKVGNSLTTTAPNSVGKHGNDRSRDGLAFVIHRVEKSETGSSPPQGTNHLENGFRRQQKEVRDRPKRRGYWLARVRSYTVH